jgi:exopolysaccharide biosynthesis polyprenyl glycosylphosphotransferase
MIRRHATALRLALAVVDAFMAVAVLALAGVVRFGSVAPLDPFFAAIPNPLGALAIYTIGWPIALWSQGLYRTRARWTIRGEIVDVARATALFAVAALSLLFLVKLPDVSRTLLLLLFPSLALVGLTTRLVLRLSLSWLRQGGRNARFVLVVGTNGPAQSFADLIESQHALGLRVVGHVDVGGEKRTVTRPVIGTIEEIEEILHGHVVDEVAICLPVTEWARIDEIARLCEDEGKIVRIPMFVLEHTLSTGRVEEFAGMPIYSIVSGPDRVIGMIAKRALDLVGAAVLLVALSPVFAAIGLAVRGTSVGPALFRQTRVGMNGRAFEVIKFRTMIVGAEDRLADLLDHNEIHGHAFKLTDDPRVTRVGRVLRRTSLDELPQLWNVLLGQMSLVGPRPPLPSEVAGYNVWHRRRLSMKPGMTGLWQVESRREHDFDRWVERDLAYIDHWSFWLDLKILWLTVPAMLGGQGR